MTGKPKRLRNGVCKFCGCTNAKACILAIQELEHCLRTVNCSWFNIQRTVCSKTSCVVAHLKEQKSNLLDFIPKGAA